MRRTFVYVVCVRIQQEERERERTNLLYHVLSTKFTLIFHGRTKHDSVQGPGRIGNDHCEICTYTTKSILHTINRLQVVSLSIVHRLNLTRIDGTYHDIVADDIQVDPG